MSSILATRLFVDPLPVWDYWVWLAIPLCVAVAIVHKSVKCDTMRKVPREAAIITFWMLLGMTVAAGALAGVVKLVEQ